jgi:hypothetical protein
LTPRYAPCETTTHGLDHYQAGEWRVWYAHITLAMAAHAWLVAARTSAAKGDPL